MAAMLWVVIVPSILLLFWLHRRRLVAAGKSPIAIPRVVSWTCVGLAAFFFSWEVLYWIWPGG
jgi:hypothetical protein